jgi:hypothetical protein
MRVQPYIHVSGAAVNSNKTDGFFDLNATQYTSYYKSNRTLSNLPIRAHFDQSKFKAKRPIPSNNTYVSIEGFLRDVDTDASGQATLFNVSIDNISFLGRAALPVPPAAGQGEHHSSAYFCTNHSSNPTITYVLAPSTPSKSTRFKFSFDTSSPSPSTRTPTSSKSTLALGSSQDTTVQRGKRKK